MTQHAGVSAERWAAFSLDQQVLMIGNELNRAARLMGLHDGPSRSLCYERALRLLDLTVEVQPGRTLRRELLRLREVLAALYQDGRPDPLGHRQAFRCLLQLTPAASRQIAALSL